MNEAELTLVMKAKNLASREVDRLHGSLGRVKGSAAKAAGGLKTLAKGASILAGGALLLLIGGLGMATKAAAEEQKGIARLDAALKANIKGFNGNTAAIERVIAKREGLAFSDDQLRDSLTILVGKYKDTDKALSLQTTAMDLARLKGISLTDATAMLSKGLDGSTKILKTLGITLPKTATEQERLTAIQKVAAGQAEAYGKTAAGAQEAFQIALGDTVEDLGSALLPVMTTVFTWLREKAIPAVKGVIATITRWVSQNQPLIAQVKAFVGGALKGLVDTLGAVVRWIGSVVSTIASNKDAMNVLRAVAAGIAGAFKLAWEAISSVIGFVARLVAKITANKALMAAFRLAWTVIGNAVGGVADALRTVVTWAGKAIDALAGLKVSIAGMPGIGGQLSALVPHAAGGWAGLHGPELAVLGERGPEYVIPNHQLGRGGPGGGAPVVIQLMLDGREVGRVVDERLYYQLQRAARA